MNSQFKIMFEINNGLGPAQKNDLWLGLTTYPAHGSTYLDTCAMSLEFQLCLLAGFVVCLLYTIGTMFIWTGPARGQTFNGEFMKQFDDMHSQAFPKQKSAPKGGLPDCGNGRFAEKMSYKDWFIMNNGQRVQGHFLECLVFYLITGYVAAVGHWVTCCISAAALALVFFARIGYAIGYTRKGPRGRLCGALFNDIALLALFGSAIAGIILMGMRLNAPTTK